MLSLESRHRSARENGRATLLQFFKEWLPAIMANNWRACLPSRSTEIAKSRTPVAIPITTTYDAAVAIVAAIALIRQPTTTPTWSSLILPIVWTTCSAWTADVSITKSIQIRPRRSTMKQKVERTNRLNAKEGDYAKKAEALISILDKMKFWDRLRYLKMWKEYSII